MKTIFAIATALTLAASTAATADECREAGDDAAAVMVARQAGTAISTLMPDMAARGERYVQMLLMAYERPRFTSEEYQAREIEDYRALWETGCYRAKAGTN